LKKSLIIFANSRAELLWKCIESVLNSHGSQDWEKVLLLQRGYPDVEKVVAKYEDRFDLVIRVKKFHEITLGNINQNRILGTSICFDLLKSEVVLGIEEDTSIAYDALYFIEEMFEKYRFKRAFRGVNLGSFESNNEVNRHTYSLLRYGLHGQAGALTRNTWKHFSLSYLLQDICHIGWDSRIESYLKTGFLPTPNASRLLDQGWGGTHQPTDPNSPYFANQRSSWVGSDPIQIRKFQQKNIVHTWRKDARIYNRNESFIYWAKHNKYLYGSFKFIRKTLRKNSVAYRIVKKLKKLYKNI
jgi:hypothetical protein